MDKVRSFEHYKETLAFAKESGYKLSNCFFLPPIIRQKVAAGTLFFHEIENGLLLLDDNTDFFRCYYFLSDSKNPDTVKLDKQAVIEFPFNVALNEKQQLQINKILSMGFQLGRESSMMTCPPEQIANQSIFQSNYAAVMAAAEDASQIFELMNQSFNPLYSFLPTKGELSVFIEENRVFVVRDNDKVAAALISGFEKKAATINQVAVNPAYRRMGLGKLLIQAYHQKYSADVVLFQHWVDIHNTAAVKMYQGFGYDFSMRKANEYVLQVKE